MKKHLITLLLLVIITQLPAEISVKSFRRLENDMDARINEPLKDQNNDVCAIIKVVTTQKGFNDFDCGQIGVMKTVQKNAEVWVYVPFGAKRMTIKHPQLGVLRDYMFPERIDKATVYEMELISGRIETIVIEEIINQYLVVNPIPSDAMIYINDQFVKNGVYQAKLKPGTYTYRVEAPLYHTLAGKVEITNKKEELNINLQPAFGYFAIKSQPEQGAKVIIDGKLQSNVTPFTSDAFASGMHTVQVVKEMYQPLTKKINILDGETSTIDFSLEPNFGNLNITTAENAILYINNQQKGKASWNGRLSPAIYSLEARQDKHKPAKQDIEIMAGENKTITLQPTPIYGSLDVMTTPTGVIINIDGKEYGTTPNEIPKLLIGNYTVQLSKAGYATTRKQVTITEGMITELMESMNQQGKMISVNSLPFGADLYVDGRLAGTTPYRGIVGYGSHKLRVIKNGESAEKAISILENTNGETSFELKIDMTAYIKKDFQKKEQKTVMSSVSIENKTPSQMVINCGFSYPLITKSNGGLNELGYELKIGVLNTFGMYTKITSNFKNTIADSRQFLANYYYKTSSTVETTYNRQGIVIGGMIDLDPFIVSVGIGKGAYKQFKISNIYSYKDVKFVDSPNSFDGVETNIGVDYKLKSFNLSAGITSIQFKYYELSIGMGVRF